MSAEHDSEAERHLDSCKAASDDGLDKADGGDLVSEMRELVKALRNTVVPSGVSTIPLTNRPVPRHGQPDLTEARKSMAPELRDVIAPTEEQPSSVQWTQRQ